MIKESKNVFPLKIQIYEGIKIHTEEVTVKP